MTKCQCCAGHVCVLVINKYVFAFVFLWLRNSCEFNLWEYSLFKRKYLKEIAILIPRGKIMKLNKILFKKKIISFNLDCDMTFCVTAQ